MGEKSIFNYFYEENEEDQLAEQAKAILDRKQRETGQPIIFDAELTEEEQAILKAYREKQWEKHLAQSREVHQEPPLTATSPASAPPPFSTPAPGYNPLTAAFQDAARKALVEVKPSPKITALEAMGLLLGRVCLRRYNEVYFVLNGYVYERIEPNGLNRLIFHYLRDVVAEVGNAGIIYPKKRPPIAVDRHNCIAAHDFPNFGGLAKTVNPAAIKPCAIHRIGGRVFC